MFEVRKAESSDAIEIAEMANKSIERKTWLYTIETNYDDKKLNDLKEEISSSKSKKRFFVAADISQKKIVGVSSYSFSKNPRIKHKINLSMGVHPDYVGQGIGTKLYEFALEDAKKSGFKKVQGEIVTKNTASLNLAKKFGFEIEGVRKKDFLTEEGNYMDSYIVGKIL